MKNLSAPGVISVSLLLLFLLVAPLFLSTYWIITLTEILIMSLFAMSFNLLFGYTAFCLLDRQDFLEQGGISQYSCCYMGRSPYGRRWLPQ